jgi:hypothetical protein
MIKIAILTNVKKTCSQEDKNAIASELLGIAESLRGGKTATRGVSAIIPAGGEAYEESRWDFYWDYKL